MKKRILAITTFIMLSLNFTVFAVGNLIVNPGRIDSAEELLSLLGGLIRPIFLVTFVAMILFGAFTYLTAGDKEDKVKSARAIILSAIIGFAVAVFAPAIIDLVSKFLGIQGGLSTGNN